MTRGTEIMSPLAPESDRRGAGRLVIAGSPQEADSAVSQSRRYGDSRAATTACETSGSRARALETLRRTPSWICRFGEVGRESERLAGRKRRAALRVEWRTVGRSHHVVDVWHSCVRLATLKPFRQGIAWTPSSREPELTAQPHIELNQVRAKAGVAAIARRTVVGEVVVPVNIRSGEQVKRMPALVGEEMGDSITTQQRRVPGARENAGDHHFCGVDRSSKKPALHLRYAWFAGA